MPERITFWLGIWLSHRVKGSGFDLQLLATTPHHHHQQNFKRDTLVLENG